MSALTGTTWIFNNTIDLSMDLEISSDDVIFTTDGVPCDFLRVYADIKMQYSYYNALIVPPITYIDSAWNSDGLKTITFVSEPTYFAPNESAFMTWLEANATQQIQQHYVTNNVELSRIANAIRRKTGGSSSLEFPGGFVNGIDSIPTGNTLVMDTTGTYTFTLSGSSKGKSYAGGYTNTIQLNSNSVYVPQGSSITRTGGDSSYDNIISFSVPEDNKIRLTLSSNLTLYYSTSFVVTYDVKCRIV